MDWLKNVLNTFFFFSAYDRVRSGSSSFTAVKTCWVSVLRTEKPKNCHKMRDEMASEKYGTTICQKKILNPLCLCWYTNECKGRGRWTEGCWLSLSLDSSYWRHPSILKLLFVKVISQLDLNWTNNIVYTVIVVQHCCPYKGMWTLHTLCLHKGDLHKSSLMLGWP